MNNEKCEFEFICHQEWDSLAKTSLNTVRFCKHCSKNVTLCYDLEEYRLCAEQKKCVCLLSSEKMVLGLPRG